MSEGRYDKPIVGLLCILAACTIENVKEPGLKGNMVFQFTRLCEDFKETRDEERADAR